ncbi:tetratricopeptide repeat protein, partial [Pseudomonas sp.]|uniref:tetratricopeptide repeat protein n=1 Tax=Pseudomonas sp. TaxID=306 RepID=UPI002589DC52
MTGIGGRRQCANPLSTEPFGSVQIAGLGGSEGDFRRRDIARILHTEHFILRAEFTVARVQSPVRVWGHADRATVCWFCILVPLEFVNLELRSDVAFKLGYSYFQEGDFGTASRYLDQVKNGTNPVAADALYYSGFMAMKQGNRQQAIQELQLASKSPFYAAKVPYLLTSLYYEEGNYAEAIAYAAPLISSQASLDQKETIHLYLGEAYYAAKDFQNASLQYEAFRSFEKGKLSEEENFKAGFSFFELKNYPKASEYLKLAALGNPEVAQAASYYLGHAYVQQGNFPFALTSFQVAAASSIHLGIQEEALFNLAKINLQRGNFQVAVNVLDEYLTNYSQGKRVVEVEALLTDALLNSSDYLRVLDQLDKLKSKSPRIQEAYQKVA